MARAREDAVRLDEAARAGWYYYVAGNTQEEIALKLRISRQAAQRLVSLSVSSGLVKVRIDHPIAACLDLAERIEATFGLKSVEVVPADPDSESTTLGIAEACAAQIEKELLRADPQILGLGTGRTLRAAVERLPTMDCPDHRVVSLTGSIGPNGSAAVYNVIFSMADKIRAPHYPMPLPVVATSARERALLHGQKVVRTTLELAARVDTAFVGIGEIGKGAPLLVDGFISDDERRDAIAAGAVGEITGWVFDEEGKLLDCAFNDRVVSAPIPRGPRSRVVGVAMGAAKEPGILAAMRGGLIHGLITNETTARNLLKAANAKNTALASSQAAGAP